jgi:hypothetical protein
MGLGLTDVDRGGLATKRGGRWRTEQAAAAFQRGKEGVAGCRRFRAAMWSWLGGLWGARKGGRVGSAGA